MWSRRRTACRRRSRPARRAPAKSRCWRAPPTSTARPRQRPRPGRGRVVRPRTTTPAPTITTWAADARAAAVERIDRAERSTGRTRSRRCRSTSRGRGRLRRSDLGAARRWRRSAAGGTPTRRRPTAPATRARCSAGSVPLVAECAVRGRLCGDRTDDHPAHDLRRGAQATDRLLLRRQRRPARRRPRQPGAIRPPTTCSSGSSTSATAAPSPAIPGCTRGSPTPKSRAFSPPASAHRGEGSPRAATTWPQAQALASAATAADTARLVCAERARGSDETDGRDRARSGRRGPGGG